MLKKLAKLCAKFALGYLPEVALWLIKLATTKTAESDRAQRALSVVEQLTREAGKLAEVMKDGIISDLEADEIKMRVSVLAEEIGELL